MKVCTGIAFLCCLKKYEILYSVIRTGKFIIKRYWQRSEIYPLKTPLSGVFILQFSLKKRMNFGKTAHEHCM